MKIKFTLKANEDFKSHLKEMLTTSGKVKDAFEKKYKNIFKKMAKEESNLEEVIGAKKLDNKLFTSRFEFGKYLSEVLADCSFSKVNRDERLWNYISCFYLDDLVTNSEKENRLRFIPHFHDLKRNLVRTPWFLYFLLKNDSQFALCTSLSEHSNMCEQFVSRQELVRNRSIGELCMNLYFDKSKKKLKTNSAKHEINKDTGSYHPGVIYPRLTKTLGKLNKIYDLWNIETDNLDEIIGEEFRFWKKNDNA